MPFLPRKRLSTTQRQALYDAEAEKVSPRTSLGLDAASEGDPRGLRRFLGWVHSELILISVAGGQPSPVAERAQNLAREVERVREFVDGFIAARKGRQK